jgi:hypothetical protein
MSPETLGSPAVMAGVAMPQESGGELRPAVFNKMATNLFRGCKAVIRNGRMLVPAGAIAIGNMLEKEKRLITARRSGETTGNTIARRIADVDLPLLRRESRAAF